jgi:K+-transporting ATPase ATPase C chain
MSIISQMRPAIMMVILFTFITGLLYPLAVTGMVQAVFPAQANGGIITAEGVAVGSTLIGQPFTDPAYFWSRPSATGPFPYNAAASSGSNLAPTNLALLDAVEERIAALRAADSKSKLPVPIDLVTASGSGLDPHISPAAAEYQVPRVAEARGLDVGQVAALVQEHTAGRQIGFLGEPRVNVLELNLALDELAGRPE